MLERKRHERFGLPLDKWELVESPAEFTKDAREYLEDGGHDDNFRRAYVAARGKVPEDVELSVEGGGAVLDALDEARQRMSTPRDEYLDADETFSSVIAEIEIDPDLIRHEPAGDVGEGLEGVWYDGRRLPGYRCTLDGITRQEWVAALEQARRKHEAGGRPDDEDYLPYT